MSCNDLMFDLETLGNNSKSPIIQIGACYFNKETGEIGETFLRNVAWHSLSEYDFVPDFSTVEWWFKQSEEARKSLLKNQKHIKTVLKDFQRFAIRCETCWCHISFDFPILTYAFKTVGLKFPVSYRKCLDIRTLICLAPKPEEKLERQGIHHNALDDSRFQVLYCSKAIQDIKKSGGVLKF